MDSPLLSGPNLIYKAKHELLWLLGTSYSHKFCLLETTSTKREEYWNKSDAMQLFYPVLLSSVLFHSIPCCYIFFSFLKKFLFFLFLLYFTLQYCIVLLYLITRHSSLCSPIPFELGTFYSMLFWFILFHLISSHSIAFHSILQLCRMSVCVCI